MATAGTCDLSIIAAGVSIAANCDAAIRSESSTLAITDMKSFVGWLSSGGIAVTNIAVTITTGTTAAAGNIPII